MPVGATGSESLHGRPPFDLPVAPGGYAWWYIDALSDDGRHGLTIIAFVGSVFSPYYAAQRRKLGDSSTDPTRFVSINAALYGANGHRWAMTERGQESLQRQPERLRIGPSSLTWNGAQLEIHLDEITVPWPSRLRGKVVLTPTSSLNAAASNRLDRDGKHHWQPIAPCAQVEVAMTAPQLAWRGSAYWDANFGNEPLERQFSGWHWSRAHPAGRQSGQGARESRVVYDVNRLDGSALCLAKHFTVAPDGELACADFPAPPRIALPRSGWRIARTTRSDAGTAAQVTATLEDGPFYARSQIVGELLGKPMIGVHESLSLARFRSRWVQALLPFRMPRVA